MTQKQEQPKKIYREGKTLGLRDFFNFYKSIHPKGLNRDKYIDVYNDLFESLVDKCIEEDIDLVVPYHTFRFGVRSKELKLGVPDWQATRELWKEKYGSNKNDWEKHKNKEVIRVGADVSSFKMIRLEQSIHNKWYRVKLRCMYFEGATKNKKKIVEQILKGNQYFYE